MIESRSERSGLRANRLAEALFHVVESSLRYTHELELVTRRRCGFVTWREQKSRMACDGRPDVRCYERGGLFRRRAVIRERRGEGDDQVVDVDGLHQVQRKSS